MFSLVTSSISIGRKFLGEIKDLPGCIIGGFNLDNVRYADDTVLITDIREATEDPIKSVKRE